MDAGSVCSIPANALSTKYDSNFLFSRRPSRASNFSSLSPLPPEPDDDAGAYDASCNAPDLIPSAWEETVDAGVSADDDNVDATSDQEAADLISHALHLLVHEEENDPRYGTSSSSFWPIETAPRGVKDPLGTASACTMGKTPPKGMFTLNSVRASNFKGLALIEFLSNLRSFRPFQL